MIETTVDKASHSETETYVMCERKHWYQYGCKLQGKSVSDSLVRGNVGHTVLAKYYTCRQGGMSHVDSVREALPLIRQEIKYYGPFDEDEMYRDMILILGSYWKTFKDDDWEILYVEVGYTIRLIEDYEMPVKIDLIVRIPGHGIVAIDHKFVWDFFNDSMMDLAPQLPKYYAALSEMNIHVDELWYNELRTRSTKDNKADFSLRFRRTPITITPTKVVTIMAEQIKAARRISALKRLPLMEWEDKILRNPQACNMCSFTQLCNADLEGQDSDLIRESFYEKRVYR